MIKKLLSIFLVLSASSSINAQIFTQDFSSSTTVSDYVSTTPNLGQFNQISPDGASITTSITNGALQFNRTGSASIYAYRNFTFSTNPKFVQLKFDFEATNFSIGTQSPVFSVFIGSGFSSANTSASGGSAYASRFGIVAQPIAGQFKVSTVDNIGGAPSSGIFSGKQTITFVVNNSGSSQTYSAPNGSTESIADAKMDVWVGTTRGINDFSLKNTASGLGDISGFKIQAASDSGTGIFNFDNIEMTSLPFNLPTYSLVHPHVWVKNTDKQQILDKIAQFTWAQNLFNQYKSRVDPTKNSHKINPATIITSIPGFPDNRTTHRNILTMGYEAALLYWLTDDDDYGQLAADILHQYVNEIAQITGNVDFHTGSSDSYLIDSREAYTKPPMIYDFVHSFLKKSGATVYDKNSATRIAFNFTNSEKTFKKLADQVFTRGLTNNNHPILESPGALFNTLVIENDSERENYLNKFMNGTSFQNGLTWMMNTCKASGTWPEATGYSLGPQRIILEMMEVVDRYKSSLNVIDNNTEIIETSFFFENYRFPNNSEVMRFGDAHRTSLDTEAMMERVLAISKRKGYLAFENKSAEILKAMYSKNGGFKPSVTTQTLEWNNPLDLLWGINLDLTNVTPITYDSSIKIDYAGIAMQRNINTSNRVESGLMGYTGGAHYVHSHLSGIDMEIYGLGAVLGTGGGDVGAGNNARDGIEFNNYHRIYAGHNTVIVNGTSKGTSAGAWNHQLYMNKTVTLAAEPVSLAAPISTEFTFSAQVLDDAINNAKQQRVFSVIRTSDNTGYYFDLFRSKSLGTNNFHDYVYHNVGDGISIVDNTSTPIPLTLTTGRYQSTTYNGGSILFPGWHYFEEVNTSNATTTAVKATIPMTKQGTRYMHILMPGGENREYTACKGPAIIEAQMGYAGIKTPIFTVRHLGEAWEKPFVSIFEPSRNLVGTVKSVENLYTGNKIVGAKVTSIINGNKMIDYVISNENDNEIFTLASPQISFTGRFAIVRTEAKTTTTDVSLYIGKGQQLTFLNEMINGDADGKASLEYSLNYSLSTSKFENLEQNITAFPNPTDGIFEINNLPLSVSSIKLGLYTIDSKLIESKTYKVNNGRVTLDISDTPKGIYIVKINLDKPVFVKVIKK